MTQARSPTRRAELLQAAMLEVSRTGLGGMSLRPLAQAIGTSDRMLIHYFGTRQGLVAALLDEAFEQLTRARADSVVVAAATVEGLWSALSSDEALPAVRLYLEASALAHGNAAWRDTLAPLTTRWLRRLEGWLVEAGASPSRAPLLAAIVSATLDGCLLRLGTEGRSADLDAVPAGLSELIGRSR